MAAHEHGVETHLPVETIWEFVREMDHWAPFLTGYQSHAKQSESESVWTLKGDVGVLARTLRFRVLVTDWAGPTRVGFTLEGLNEPMTGEGAFTLETLGADASAAQAAACAVPARPRDLAWLWDRLVRFLFRRARGPAALRAPRSEARTTRMTFRLRVDPGGPMAPMIDALMRPAMAAAAEDLAQRIVAHLEAGAAGAASTAQLAAGSASSAAKR